ncbi:MAG: methylthioribulose 1-phosphate dehydratase [Cyanobacteria bacterium P01_A01_bin.84]
METRTIALTKPRPELMAAARYFYQQGWMMGTAGNLSARMPDGSFWITASGKYKGDLQLGDFVKVSSLGEVSTLVNGLKPSAETTIHQTIYTLFPEVYACYHVHSIEANLVSNLVTNNELHLPPLEMLKGLGVLQENPDCVISIFTNYSQVSRIAEDIKQQFSINPPQIPALLIRNHGLTVWAPTQEKARNYIEIMEYIFRYMIAAVSIPDYLGLKVPGL